MNRQAGETKPRMVIGMVLIVLAVLLFLNNIGFKIFGLVLSHWPLAFAALGAYLIYMGRKEGGNYRSIGLLPYGLLAVGVIFSLSKYGVLRFGIGALFGPLILLLGGLYLFSPSSLKCRKHRQVHNAAPPSNKEGSEVSLAMALEADSETSARPDNEAETQTKETPRSPDSDTKIDIFTLLGGGNYSTRSNRLVGGSIVCLLGGAEVDIREADSQEDVIELDILAFMGGAELKIPPHWQVTVKAIPLLGGVSNRTTCLAEKMGVPKRELVISGLACLGGIEVRN